MPIGTLHANTFQAELLEADQAQLAVLGMKVQQLGKGLGLAVACGSGQLRLMAGQGHARIGQGCQQLHVASRLIETFTEVERQNPVGTQQLFAGGVQQCIAALTPGVIADAGRQQ